MNTVTSNDGSTIAYDRHGSGPVVILVNGALGSRKFKHVRQLSELLAETCTVVNYDRRGRGDSTEATPFSHETALDREIEDIAALIEAEGGRASLWGTSSGGALALRAAAALTGVEKVSVYEVPVMVDPEHNRPTPDYGPRLDELVAADDRAGLVRHFMRNAIGIPAPFVFAMRFMPMWKDLKANAPTLRYDWEALGAHTMYGAPLDPTEWGRITVPVQVVHGGKTMPVLKQGSEALAEVLPDATPEVIPGASHNVPMDKLAPILAGFVAGEREIINA